MQCKGWSWSRIRCKSFGDVCSSINTEFHDLQADTHWSPKNLTDTDERAGRWVQVISFHWNYSRLHCLCTTEHGTWVSPYQQDIYTRAILHLRCRILFYTKLLYSTKFSTVQYSRFSIIQYFRGARCSTKRYWTLFSSTQYFFYSVLTCGVE
jgi:hypothetical protein